MFVPIAATVAGAEPEIAAKKVDANTVTWAKLAFIDPTKESTNTINRLDNPPVNIKSPAKINSGTASKGYEFIAVTIDLA
jgi:hypothetical protein